VTNAESDTADDRTSKVPDPDLLTFKLCVVALWADGAMVTAERDQLSRLINSLARSEQERSELRRIALLQDVNAHEVLAEVDRLGDTAKRHLFDRCVTLLASDRRIGRSELRFLVTLRRRCGIGFWTFRRLVWRARWKVRLAAAVLLAAVAAVLLVTVPRHEESGLPPGEIEFFQEIALRAAPTDRVLLQPEELYEVVRSSVVTINVVIGGVEEGNGSGAVIGWDDLGQLYILTNRHVVYHELPEGRDLCFEAELESGIQLPALLDFYSRKVDLALLVVPGLAGWAEPLGVLPRQALRVGERVYAVGSPMGLAHSFTSGVISALRPDSIQTDATVYFGSSGGPLVDSSGALCGVITTTHSHKDISFAIYADAILDLLIERRQAKTTE
jgi:hypothetical protein